MRRVLTAVLLLATLPAEAETLRYEVTLFGVEVGEVRFDLGQDRIRIEGETSGALTLFFPATETVDIRLRGGRPVAATRRYDHAGKKGEWRARFRNGRVDLEQRTPEGVRRRTLPVPARAVDPASALQRLRRAAPARHVSLLVFGADGVYRFEARRIARRPLRYRGTFRVLKRLARRRKVQVPLWLRTLGFGKNGSRRPRFDVELTDDSRRLPTRIRLSDPRGTAELVLREPKVAPPPASDGEDEG